MDRIHVTKTFLPPLEEYTKYLSEVWASHYVTNDGPLYQRFEKELSDFTGQEHVACQGNGTLSLQIGIRALGLANEIITTPFSHYATSGSLVWEGCKPVFVDIDPYTFNIDPRQIEPRITERTTGILATHVYSNPCDVHAIQKIADRNGLKVMYDGAHAFGASVNGNSIFSYGDLAMASFNATKGFHTMEGGALFARNKETIDSIRRLSYFGMDKTKEIQQPYGINAKMPEVCAAMGLANFRYFPAALQHRKHIYETYLSQLEGTHGLTFQKLTGEINYSYVPLLAESPELKQQIFTVLNKEEIYPRSYFYPSLETVFSDSTLCPIAESTAERIMCLPSSDYLTIDDVSRICKLIKAA